MFYLWLLNVKHLNMLQNLIGNILHYILLIMIILKSIC